MIVEYKQKEVIFVVNVFVYFIVNVKNEIMLYDTYDLHVSLKYI